MKHPGTLIEIQVLKILFVYLMYVSTKENRINNPVVLKVKPEVVSRPGVLFTDCNAARRDAQIGKDPNIVRFDITQAKSVFAVCAILPS